MIPGKLREAVRGMPQQLCRVGSNSRCIARLDNPVQTGNGFGGKVIEAPLLHAGMCLFSVTLTALA